MSPCSNTNTNTNTNTNMKTRWCPTPEQVMILEELYRRGLKTPNATQIQRITGHLSTYGNIQGKNVFYWFQNHKARDRQKLRKKQLQLHHHLFQPHQFHYFPLNFLHPQQGTAATGNGGVCEEMGPGVTMSYWMANCFMGPSYEGPGNNSEPLQTLELFPLRSPKENTPS